MPSPGMQRLFRQMERKKPLTDSTVQKMIQQYVMEHERPNRAHKKLWSATASGSASRCLDSCPASVRSGRESDVDSTHLFLTVIQLAAQVILIFQPASTGIHNLITHSPTQSPVTMGE